MPEPIPRSPGYRGREMEGVGSKTWKMNCDTALGKSRAVERKNILLLVK